MGPDAGRKFSRRNLRQRHPESPIDRPLLVIEAVRDSLPEPDPFRLRYRTDLAEVGGEIVRRRIPQTEAAVAESARSIVDAGDIPAFTQLVLQEVASLHEGNIARFRLRPSEFLQRRSR